MTDHDPVDHYRASSVRIASGDAEVAVHHLAGRSALPPLLVSHATGFHAHAYRVLARSLADRHDVHRHDGRQHDVWGLDHRGHGVTALPPGTQIDWRTSGADTAAVGRHLAPGGDLVGFGHSMGGATLLLAAQRDPQLFRRLVLFEPIAFPTADAPDDPTDTPLGLGALRRRRRFDSYDAAFANFASKPPLDRCDPEVLRDYVDFGFGPEGQPDHGVTLRCTPEVESATFAASMTSGLWDLLPHIDVPVVVIGSGDGQQPALVAPQIADRLPRATFVAVPHQTHFGPFSHPAEVARIVADAVT